MTLNRVGEAQAKSVWLPLEVDAALVEKLSLLGLAQVVPQPDRSTSMKGVNQHPLNIAVLVRKLVDAGPLASRSVASDELCYAYWQSSSLTLLLSSASAVARSLIPHAPVNIGRKTPGTVWIMSVSVAHHGAPQRQHWMRRVSRLQLEAERSASLHEMKSKVEWIREVPKGFPEDPIDLCH